MKKLLNVLLILVLTGLLYTSCKKEDIQYYTWYVPYLSPVYNEASYIQDYYDTIDFDVDSEAFLVAGVHDAIMFDKETHATAKYLGGYIDLSYITEGPYFTNVSENNLDHNDTVYINVPFDVTYAIFEISNDNTARIDTIVYGNDELGNAIQVLSFSYPDINDNIYSLYIDPYYYQDQYIGYNGIIPMYFLGSIPFWETNVDSLKLIYHTAQTSIVQ